MSTLATIKLLVKDISTLSTSLLDSVQKGSKDDKIYCIMNTEEQHTLHKTFNQWFNALFAEDCHDSNGHLHLVCRGKLGMGLVVLYLSKINWTIGFPLDLVELKLQCLVTELKGLQYVPDSIIHFPYSWIIRQLDVPQPVHSLNLTVKLKDTANASAPELSFQWKAVQDYHSCQTEVYSAVSAGSKQQSPSFIASWVSSTCAPFHRYCINSTNQAHLLFHCHWQWSWWSARAMYVVKSPSLITCTDHLIYR
jgi:hypothetical protein